MSFCPQNYSYIQYPLVTFAWTNLCNLIFIQLQPSIHICHLTLSILVSKSPPLSIYLLTISMHTWFLILQVFYNSLLYSYFGTKIVLDLSSVSPFKLKSIFFKKIISFISGTTKCCRSLLYLFCFSLVICHFSKKPQFLFIRKLDTKVCMQSVLIATVVSLFLCAFSRQGQEIYSCMQK